MPLGPLQKVWIVGIPPQWLENRVGMCHGEPAQCRHVSQATGGECPRSRLSGEAQAACHRAATRQRPTSLRRALINHFRLVLSFFSPFYSLYDKRITNLLNMEGLT